MALYNVLIIDDHPIIASAYKSALAFIEGKDSSYEFTIDSVSTLDEAKEKFSPSNKTKYDLIFLDIKLPVSSDAKLLSGEDLGVKIREVSPESKIIIATTYNDNYRVNNILKSVNPEGFLVKNDIKPENLTEAITSVLNSTPYYSQTVIRLLRKHISHDFFLDKIDRQLLYELSNGAKMVDLPKVIPMSIGGIERRKRQLKDLFDITNKDDRTLVEVAKQKGFL